MNMAGRRKLNIEQKARIVALKEQNISNSEIARRIGCTEGSIRYCFKKYATSSSLERKVGSGRKKKLSKRDERALKRLALKNRFASASELRVSLEETTSTVVSTRTIQRKLNEMGLKSRRPAKKPLLTTEMKKKRLEWAKHHASWSPNDWKNVIFSDESKFNLFGPDGQKRVRRRTGERYSGDCILPTVKHSPYVMVWGCITSRGVRKLICLEGSVDAKKYKEIILDGLVPTIEELSEHVTDILFQDDSAPCHRARVVKDFKEELGIQSLSWPGNSPDLNPIENLWAVMGKKVREIRPTTLESMKKL